MRFRELRKDAGISPRAIGIALGVSESIVYKWDRGTSTPNLTPSQTKALIELLGCSLADLTVVFGQGS